MLHVRMYTLLNAHRRSFLKAFNYDYMVLDEGHSIKNAKSARFQKLAAVNSSHRLLLSGTPVQNNLKEVSGFSRNDLRNDPPYYKTQFDGAIAPVTADASSVKHNEARLPAVACLRIASNRCTSMCSSCIAHTKWHCDTCTSR
jgi:SNF2-related domain